MIFCGVSQLFCVKAGSRPCLKMHVHPEKVTSTCSQSFAELDPHCPGMSAGACESFKDDADACRLSLTDSRHVDRRCAHRACGTPPRLARWSGRCSHDPWSIPCRDSRFLDAAVTVAAGVDAKLRQLLPASKLILRRRSAEVRPGLASPHHPRCLVSLRQSAAGPPGSTLIASL